MQDFLRDIRLDKKKLITVALVFVALSYVDFSFILKAQAKALTASKAKVAKLQSDLLAVKRDMAAMQQSEAKDKDQSKARKVVSEGELLSLLEQVSQIAKNNAVRVTQINPLKSSRAPVKAGQPLSVFQAVLIKLDLNCGYHSLGAFINDLENNEYVVSTEDIRITPDFSAGPRERVLLTLKTYVKN